MRRILGFVLLASIAGCGNVETGGVSTEPPAGDDDDDGSTATPAPTGTPGGGGNGQVPSEAGGMVVFARNRTHDANDFIGMANFFPIPVPLPPTFATVWAGFPDHPIDTCERVYPSSVGLSTNQQPPDAGTLTLEGPNGSVSADPFMGQYLTIWNPPSLFVPVSTYTLKASGGSIPAFQRAMQSPGDVTTLNPDILATHPFHVSRSIPLNLKWQSVQDGKPIFLFLEQQDQPEQEKWIFMCKIADDGEFDVPVDILQNFGPTVLPFPTEDWRDKLHLRRFNYGSFEVPGAVAPILTGFESGWYADVQFE